MPCVSIGPLPASLLSNPDAITSDSKRFEAVCMLYRDVSISVSPSRSDQYLSLSFEPRFRRCAGKQGHRGPGFVGIRLGSKFHPPISLSSSDSLSLFFFFQTLMHQA